MFYAIFKGKRWETTEDPGTGRSCCQEREKALLNTAPLLRLFDILLFKISD